MGFLFILLSLMFLPLFHPADPSLPFFRLGAAALNIWPFCVVSFNLDA
jgi:hypothetical protein